MRASVVALMLVVVMGAVLAACSPAALPVSAPPSPSSTPVFASEEEALAAAEEAYGAYLAMSDLISNDGGADPGRIHDVSAGDLADTELEGFAQLAAQGLRSVGTSQINNFVSQEVDLSGSPIVVAYVCTDVSAVDVLNSSGSSVVSDSRPDLQPFAVAFDKFAGQLLPVSRDVWDGGGVCI
ncbi:hypothetical protein BH11ACT3_BH11ACT3_01810 [soil metagenome]